MTLDLHTVAQYSTLRIVDSLIEGTLIGVFAMILLRLARRQSAGTRFAIWFSALIAIALLPVLNGALSSYAGFSTSLVRHAAVTVPESWALYMFAGWATIAGWFLLGVGRSLWHLRRLRKGAVSVDLLWLDPLLQNTFHDARIGRKIDFCVSDRVRVPTAIGLTKPAVIFPDWVMRELSSSELNQILLHELAHLRRRDDWTNLVQQIVRALFFFHPAVWWIEKNAALEREIACDDAVLAQTPSPRAYAECLAHLAERSFVQRSLALAQAALGRMRQTSARVAEILDGNRPRANARAWKPAVLMVAAFAVVSAAGVSQAPRLVTFQSNGSPATASAELQMQTSAQEFPEHIRIVPAKLTLDGDGQVALHHKPAPAAHPAVLKPKAANAVHSASAKVAAIPVTETLFVVIQGQDQTSSEAHAYQEVQMWHVTYYLVKSVARAAPVHRT